MMDPFALQHEARKKTGRLVVLEVAAVVSVVACLGFALSVVFWIAACLLKSGDGYGVRNLPSFADFILDSPSRMLAAVLIALFLYVIGILVEGGTVRSGASLMSLVGAKRVVRRKLGRQDEWEERGASGGGDAQGDLDIALLRYNNVCEEISIAACADMPSLWVLDGTDSVNAFVAGVTPSSAALCVTEGALRYLERDELQAVVAHEFSHIVNGDMQLNFRLLSAISGITAISRMGRGMFRVFRGSGDGKGFRFRFPKTSGGKGGGAIAIVVLLYFLTATLLWLIGSIGVFFARLIQCAVSREREFLADASSAQFTRNPEALANALRLTYLAGDAGGDKFNQWRDDIAHLLFTEGMRSRFATHPSVKDRIARLSRGGIAADDRLKERVRAIRERRMEGRRAINEKILRKAAERRREEAMAFTAPSPMGEAERRAGEPGAFVVPAALNARLRGPDGAGGVLVQLLRGQTPAEWGARAMTNAARRRLAIRCVTMIRDTETPAARRKWVETIESIVREDGEYDSFEFMVSAVARRRLAPDAGVRIVAPRILMPTVARVVATVAGFGRDPAAGYLAANRRLSLFGGPLPPMPPPYGDAVEFLDGLGSLEALPPLAKRELLMGLKATVAQDGAVADEEADYLSAVADAIGAMGWN